MNFSELTEKICDERVEAIREDFNKCDEDIIKEIKENGGMLMKNYNEFKRKGREEYWKNLLARDRQVERKKINDEIYNQFFIN